MKAFETHCTVEQGGTLVLQELPFATGDRVKVVVSLPADEVEMREYAERMAEFSGDFLRETEKHIASRLLRETEW
jgi:hypothetical protein